MVIHRWGESISTWWVKNLMDNFTYYRGGCVVFMDYSNHSVLDYGVLVSRFVNISAVLLKKFIQIGNYDRMYCFGFSYGSRLCIDAGVNLVMGNSSRQISRMDFCDPAGPSFDGNVREKLPTSAAKNVACINTRNNYGTTIYNCHQNFRMGNCGFSQVAAGPFPLGSHGLCVKFFTLAFNVDYTPNNYYKCTSKRMANLTSDVKMGYMATFNRYKKLHIKVITSIYQSTELWCGAISLLRLLRSNLIRSLTIS
jgi:hypothetical protein